jgi:hypothetical protein
MMMFAEFGSGSGRVAVLAASLLLAGGAAWTPPAQAAQEVGEAVVVVSSVRGKQGELTREIEVQDNVFSQEVIETGADSATRIVFLDGTELSMGPSSSVTLDRYVYDPAQGTGQLVMNVISGVFEFASGAIPSEGYDIRTPFATIAVRGTRIDIVALQEGVVGVKEGTVLVTRQGATSVLGPDECFVLPAGATQAEIRSGDACLQPLAPIALMLAALAGPPAGPLVPQVNDCTGGQCENDPRGPFGDRPASPN